MNKKIYFAADFHLGIKTVDQSVLEREKTVCAWLDMAAKDADEIFLLGDLFDFWFEYKRAIPRGHSRFLGKLAEIADSGIPIHIFTGNHDLWMFGYFQEEMGIPVYHSPIIREWNGKKFMLGHGDGLGPGDYGYKRLKKLFTNPLAQWLFAGLHPNLGIKLANYWSAKSRKKSVREEFLGSEKEWLIQYSEEQLKLNEDIDYFIFGHRHLPIVHRLSNKKSTYINVGDWLNHFTYAVFDGEKAKLEPFKKNTGVIIESE